MKTTRIVTTIATAAALVGGIGLAYAQNNETTQTPPMPPARSMQTATPSSGQGTGMNAGSSNGTSMSGTNSTNSTNSTNRSNGSNSSYNSSSMGSTSSTSSTSSTNSATPATAPGDSATTPPSTEPAPKADRG